MIDIRQTQEYANYMRSLGWVVERIEKTNYFIRRIPLLGSILKVQRPEEIRFDTIDKLCRKYGVFQTIIEPSLSTCVETFEDCHKLMIAHSFKLAKSTFLPSKTLQIDLTKSRVEIEKHFKKDVRYALRKASGSDLRFGEPQGSEKSHRLGEGSGVKIKEYSTPEEIKIFREGWKKCVKFNRYVPSAEQLIKLKKSFPQAHSIFLASHNISGSIIGGALFTTSSHERSNYITYYWQAFTDPEGRALLSQYSLLYQGILWAKKNGYKVFDFEGIFDPRFPNKSWLGFTHFKRSFGGFEVEYPGCYTKFRFPSKI